MNSYPHLAARALNKPLLLDASYARIFFAALGQRLQIEALTDVSGQAHSVVQMSALAAGYGRRASSDKLYSVQGSVAILPVDGTLVHKSGYVGSSSGVMGYDGLDAQIKAANADPAIRGILLDVNSPGGEVSGVKELANAIKGSAKPVWAHGNELAASAAYWTASAASRLYLSDTAEVGSIGVLMAHADYSKAMDKAGIQVTLIHSGANKVDGNPYAALPADVRTSFQADIDQLRQLFASIVAANRGITTEQVLQTEARLYRGQAAVEIGLADGVKSFDETLQDFQQFLSPSGASMKGKRMSTHDANASAAPAGGEFTHTQAQIDAARAEGHAQGLQAGATAERTRITGIMSSEAAAGREATAKEFALSTNMSAEDALRVLATVPVSGNLSAKVLNEMSATTPVKPCADADKVVSLADRIATARAANKR
jgi:capsid assembly protease